MNNGGLRVISFTSFVFLACGGEEQLNKLHSASTTIDSTGQHSHDYEASVIVSTSDPVVYDVWNVILDQQAGRDMPTNPAPDRFRDFGEIDGLLAPVSMQEPGLTLSDKTPGICKRFAAEDIAFLKSQADREHSDIDLSRLGLRKRLRGASVPTAGLAVSGDDAWMTLSYPIFTRDSSLALVTVESLCPGLCGSGYNVIIDRQSGDWRTYRIGGWFH